MQFFMNAPFNEYFRASLMHSCSLSQNPTFSVYEIRPILCVGGLKSSSPSRVDKQTSVLDHGLIQFSSFTSLVVEAPTWLGPLAPSGALWAQKRSGAHSAVASVSSKTRPRPPPTPLSRVCADARRWRCRRRATPFHSAPRGGVGEKL